MRIHDLPFVGVRLGFALGLGVRREPVLSPSPDGMVDHGFHVIKTEDGMGNA